MIDHDTDEYIADTEDLQVELERLEEWLDSKPENYARCTQGVKDRITRLRFEIENTSDFAHFAQYVGEADSDPWDEGPECTPQEQLDYEVERMYNGES